MQNAIDSITDCPNVEVARTSKSEPVLSMHRRLPRGPHDMTKNEVLHNQLHRIHSAMVEAVSRWGYGGTTVARVIQLSGVSRRAFYEQFSCREDCLIRTAAIIGFQLLSAVRERYSSTRDVSEDPARKMLEIFLDELQRRPKAARLLLIEAPQLGPVGAQAAINTISALEPLVLGGVPEAQLAQVPSPVRYGVTSALRWILEQPLRGEEAPRLAGLTDVTHSWVMLLNSQRLGALKPGKIPPESTRVKDATDDVRRRLLDSVLELAITE
ncbi:MAG: TetR/AcrR family transcriptional regulator, partial [Solirubrobacteraceae bacterium]